MIRLRFEDQCLRDLDNCDMNRGIYYGMVTVQSSSEYTELALESLFKVTEFGHDDQFVLIDNDGDWSEHWHRGAFSQDNVLINPSPRNTSQNINTIIELAQEHQQDAVFLSNDVIFTPGWNTRFLTNTVTVPACNQTHDYGIPAALSIAEFDDQYQQLHKIAAAHMQNNRRPFEQLIMPTYVCCIPHSVYSIVGRFDESFNVGGEDVDYRIRCIQAGFDVKYTNGFLLHFNGRSSWNGPETMDQVVARDVKYKSKFIDKWGKDLYNLCITGGNVQEAIAKYNLDELIQAGQFNQAIRTVLDHV